MSQSPALEFEPGRHRSFYYQGWLHVSVAVLAMVATLPGRTLGLGLLTEPLLADLRLARVDYGWINLWATLLGSMFSLAFGPLVDRLGVRLVLALNALLLGSTVIWMSHIHSAAELTVTMILTRGLGQSALSVVSVAIVGKWFVRRVHTAMGVYSALVSIGFIIAIPVVQHAVEHSGWRHPWSVIGWSLVAGLAPLAWLLVRPSPESIGLAVDGEFAGSDPTRHTSTMQSGKGGRGSASLGAALASPAFWVFAVSCAVFNMIFSGVSIFAEGIVRERGFFDAGTFRSAMGLLVLGGLIANFAGGFLAGKWPLSQLLGVGMLGVTAAMLVLPLSRNTAGVAGFAILMGLAGGLVTVVFFACWPRMFGRGSLGRIQGAAQVLTVLASAAGPLLLALGQRGQGSYGQTFLLMSPVTLVLAVACWIVPLPTNVIDGGGSVKQDEEPLRTGPGEAE